MLLHIYNQRNTAYSKWKIASERINISLPLEMAADGLAARCRRTSVRCGSKSGAIPASCGSGGQPACLPCPAPSFSIQNPFRGLSAISAQPRSRWVKPSQTQSSSGLPHGPPGPQTRNPRPERWVKPGQGQSSLVLPPGTPDPRPETPDPMVSQSGSNL